MTAPLLSVRDLVVRYGEGRGAHLAVDGVSFDVHEGRTLGIVGESGSGKSTIARVITGLTGPSSGSVTLDGLTHRARQRLPRHERARQTQMIFQDPSTSLNPRMTVRDTLREGLRATGPHPAAQESDEIERVLAMVRLSTDVLSKRPSQLSGGMRQRVCIARVLAVRPRLIVADEITSALDASVQGAVLNLLAALRREVNTTIVFISHNLAAVRYIADEIMVMERGRVVEAGDTSDILEMPQQEYTRALIRAVPSVTSENRARVVNVMPGALT